MDLLRGGFMVKKFKIRKTAMAFMLVAAMAVPSLGGGGALAAEDTNDTVRVEATSEDKTVEVGNVTVTNREGVIVKSDEDYNATVTTGDITTKDDGNYLDGVRIDPVGVKVNTFEESSANITTGDIKADSDGVYVESSDDSSASITTGNITTGNITTGSIVTDDQAGISVKAYNNANVEVTTGNIKADFDGVYVYVEDDSSASITTGDIETTKRRGIYAEAEENAKIEVIAGDIKAKLDGVEIYLTDGGSAKVEIKGDINSEKAGIYFDTDNENAKADILVDGTVSGERAGVVFYNDRVNECENLTLTVWKIKLNEDGKVAINDRVYSNNSFNDIETFEKNIMYIMRVNQPEEGGTISLTDEKGGALKQSYDYEVAKESDKVYVKVTPDEGYKLTGAYNGEDGEKLELLKDDDGNYYIVVPKGGGVTLAATLEKEEYDISFYDDDGKLIQSSKAFYGDSIKIPEAPVKEGYKFLYWEGSKYYPGDEYTVKSAHTFKAVWEKIEEPEEETSEEETAAPTGSSDKKTDAPSASPATDDTTNLIILFTIMMISGACAALTAGLKIKISKR